MSELNDGGPAFPIPPVGTGDPRDGMSQGSFGMTLRDWFAGQALAGLLANPTVREWEAAASEQGDPDALVQVCALMAYKQADAMLAERGKGGGR